MTDTSVADTSTSTASTVLNAPPPPPPFWDGFTDANLKLAAEKSGLKSAEEAFARAQKFDAYKDADPANLILAPKPDAKPEDHLKVLERLGLPKEAADYKLTEIEGVDKPTAEWAQTTFKEAGLLPWQAQLIAAKQKEFVEAGQAQIIAEEQAAADREIAQLQSPQGWGQAFNENREAARRAFKAAGVGAETIAYLESGMGVKGVLELGAFFGKFIKEGAFVEGGKNTTQPTMLEKLYPNDVAKDRAAQQR